ncbi:MAG: hypothetical protein Q7U24_02385, partial [Sulfurimicrobium sp.]|nr:hypothetical protein [Sulfurimicrobium sp.]
DIACEYGAATVKLHDNTIDRTQNERSRDGEKIFDSKVDDAKSNRRYADKCSFSYYTNSDEKGRILATAAKDECYKNEMLKESGRGNQISLDAYNLWKDHKVASKRAVPPPAPSLTCRPDGLGNMNCNPW